MKFAVQCKLFKIEKLVCNFELINLSPLPTTKEIFHDAVKFKVVLDNKFAIHSMQRFLFATQI